MGNTGLEVTPMTTLMNRKNLVVAAMAIVLVAIFATVAAAMYEGVQPGGGNHPAGNSLTVGRLVQLPANGGPDVVTNVAQGVPSSANTILQPYFGPGPFQPGSPPFGPLGQVGASGDGLSAWGVAFKETVDANAQPDASLIKSAYQNAQKKADELASAAGLKLGKLVAITDYTQAEPYYNKLCVQPEMGRPQAVPPAAQGAPKGTGSGSTGTGTVVPVEPPQPVPAPCQAQRYLVAWVLIRYQIQN
jgi:hypothetical protein